MMPCEICGETKYEEEFYKVRWFYKYCEGSDTKQWCRACQKMFIAMKKKQGRVIELSAAAASFLMEFR
jgi:hypothetical protein